MKALLLQNIKGLGMKGEVKDVSEGYFRNMLAPRKLAVQATSSAMKTKKEHEMKRVEKLEKLKESALYIKNQIEGKQVDLKEKTHDGGKLYAAVNAPEIQVALKNQLKVDIPSKSIQLKETIKECGDYKVAISLHKEVSTTIQIHVTAAE